MVQGIGDAESPSRRGKRMLIFTARAGQYLTFTYLTQRPGVAERADALEVADQIDALAPVAAGEVGALVDIGTAVTTCVCVCCHGDETNKCKG